MLAHAASLILSGFIEADGGTAFLAEDDLCPSNLRGVAGGKPFKLYVVGSQPGEGQYHWRISVPAQVLDDELDITIIGAIKATPMTCTYIFMPRAFLKILGKREGESVWVGLQVNPAKGGFVTQDRPWPIIQDTSRGFPAEPVPHVKSQEQRSSFVLQ
jgi:hypothetical protein